MDWTQERNDILVRFLTELMKPTGDGSTKRQGGLKPPWFSDDSHEGAIFSHLTKWKRGQKVDPESGAHPLVHAAWRCLAIACIESGNIPNDRPSSAPSGLSNNNSTKTGTVCGTASGTGLVLSKPGPEVGSGDSGNGDGGCIRYVSPWTRADREDGWCVSVTNRTGYSARYYIQPDRFH